MNKQLPQLDVSQSQRIETEQMKLDIQVNNRLLKYFIIPILIVNVIIFALLIVSKQIQLAIAAGISLFVFLLANIQLISIQTLLQLTNIHFSLSSNYQTIELKKFTQLLLIIKLYLYLICAVLLSLLWSEQLYTDSTEFFAYLGFTIGCVASISNQTSTGPLIQIIETAIISIIMIIRSALNFNISLIPMYLAPFILVFLIYKQLSIKKSIYLSLKRDNYKQMNHKKIIDEVIPSKIFICSVNKNPSLILDQNQNNQILVYILFGLFDWPKSEKETADFKINYANKRCLSNFISSDLAELQQNLQDLKCEQDPSKNIFSELNSNLINLTKPAPQQYSILYKKSPLLRAINNNNNNNNNNNKNNTEDEDKQSKIEVAGISDSNWNLAGKRNLDDNDSKGGYAKQEKGWKTKLNYEQINHQIQELQLDECMLPTNTTESQFTFIFNKQYYTAQFSQCLWEKKISILVILTNVSAEKRNVYLEQINNYKDKLLASVSHDLKTPLNCILSVVDYLVQINEQKSFDDHLRLIQNNTQMLLYMINDILDYSKQSHQQLRLNISTFCLSTVIKEVFSLFSLQAKSQNIQLKLNISYNYNTLIYNDKNRFKQILINLISNALKFTREGSIQVGAHQIEDGNISISVSDTGIGMSDSVKKQLFQDYSSFDNQYHTNAQGVGLGLVICQKLIGLIGKSDLINVESSQGKGSCFSFTLLTNYQQKSSNSSEEADYSMQLTDPNIDDKKLYPIQPLNKKISKFSQADTQSKNLDDSSTKIQIAFEQSNDQILNQQDQIQILGRTMKTISMPSFQHPQKQLQFDQQNKKTSPNLVYLNINDEYIANNSLNNCEMSKVKTMKPRKVVSDNNMQFCSLKEQQKQQTIQNYDIYNPDFVSTCNTMFGKNNSNINNCSNPILSNNNTFQPIQESFTGTNTSINNEKKDYNIMVVDDSQYNIIAIKLQLREFKHFHIEEYLFSELALERIKLKDISFDIIFCDMNMPFMNGSQFISAIRNLNDSIDQPKIVLISADSQNNESIQLLKQDVSLFFTKPILDKNKFCHKIKKLLNQL